MDYFKKSTKLPPGFNNTNFPTPSHSPSTASALGPESFSQAVPKVNSTETSGTPQHGPYGSSK